MNSDFSNVNLYFPEKVKLFIMRFKKWVTAEFLGSFLRPLLDNKFITSYYEFRDAQKTQENHNTIYTLTDRYFRYCVYRRHKFFDSKLWPFVISVVASVITSILTTLLLLKLGLQ